MNYQQINDTAREGRELLSKGVFPNELLEKIKDRRAAKEVSNKIFYPADAKKHHELNEKEKAERARRLKIEIAYGRYIDGMNSLTKTPIYFALIALFIFGMNFLKPFGNEAYGFMTLTQAVIALVFVVKPRFMKKNTMTLVLLITVIQFLELAIFQFPTPLLYGSSIDLSSRVGAFWEFLNVSSPFIYLGSKLGIIAAMIMAFRNINRFKFEKNRFEQG